MIDFREVELGDAKKILDWRTSERVTNFMNSDIKYDLKEQEHWLSLSFNKSSYYHWIIQYRGKDIGLLNFVDLDIKKKSTSWGFYIGEDTALGLGGLVPPFFYNFAFDVLNVDKIYSEVFYDNIRTVNFHLKQGCSFSPDRDYVINKNGRDILIICMEIHKKDFTTSKFAHLKTELPIAKWSSNPFRKKM